MDIEIPIGPEFDFSPPKNVMFQENRCPQHLLNTPVLLVNLEKIGVQEFSGLFVTACGLLNRGYLQTIRTMPRSAFSMSRFCKNFENLTRHPPKCFKRSFSKFFPILRSDVSPSSAKTLPTSKVSS